MNNKITLLRVRDACKGSEIKIKYVYLKSSNLKLNGSRLFNNKK